MKNTNEVTTRRIIIEKNVSAPSIVFGLSCLHWIQCLANEHETEVGFNGIVDELEDGSYYVREIIYPKNDVANGGTCEISPLAMSDLIMRLMDEGRDSDIGKVKLWGHSHVDMGVGASGQDEKQALESIKSSGSYLIRIICNKRGDLGVSFFDVKNGYQYDNVKWKCFDDTPDRYYQSTIDSIKAIIDGVEDMASKIRKIRGVCDNDVLFEEIKSKVIDLKKVNMPSSNSSVEYKPPSSNGEPISLLDGLTQDLGDIFGGGSGFKSFDISTAVSRAVARRGGNR